MTGVQTCALPILKLFKGQSKGDESDSYEFEISEKNPATLNSHEFSFDNKAQLHYNAWITKFEGRLRREKFASSALHSHLGKFRKLYPSMALILFLIEHPEPSTWRNKKIPVKYCVMAEWWCKYLEEQATRLYTMYLSTAQSAAQLLLVKIMNGLIESGTPVREITRNKWQGLTDPDLVRDGLKSLEKNNYLIIQDVQGTQGRSSPTVFLNPNIVNPAGGDGGNAP